MFLVLFICIYCRVDLLSESYACELPSAHRWSYTILINYIYMYLLLRFTCTSVMSDPVTYYWQRPNMVKYIDMMKSDEMSCIVGKYIFEANKLRV